MSVQSEIYQSPIANIYEKRPMRVYVQCPKECSFSTEKAGPERATLAEGWLKEGMSQNKMRDMARALGWVISSGSMSRHCMRHVYRVIDPESDPEIGPLINPEKRLSDLDIIERIIQKGAMRLLERDSRVTPDMTMKALELKMKLTQGSVFDPLFEALAGAMATGEPGKTGKDEDVVEDAEE